MQAQSRETGPAVNAWIRDAKAIEEDINKVKLLSNEIERLDQARNEAQQAVEDAEAQIKLLNTEVAFTTDVEDALTGIRTVQEMLANTKESQSEGKIVKAIATLHGQWNIRRES